MMNTWRVNPLRVSRLVLLLVQVLRKLPQLLCIPAILVSGSMPLVHMLEVDSCLVNVLLLEALLHLVNDLLPLLDRLLCLADTRQSVQNPAGLIGLRIGCVKESVVRQMVEFRKLCLIAILLDVTLLHRRLGS